MTHDWMRKGGLAAGLVASVCLIAPAAAAQEGSPQADAQTEEADSALAQYQFNLAPAQTAPGAQAEVLLTERPTGGYSADLQASALPDPASLKEGASTYVVWLYDAAAKKKERVAELPAAGGSGQSAFDILWPTFALVVTAEPSAEPREWSGVAVLTGQPVVPPNPGPDVDAAQAAVEAPAVAEAAAESGAVAPEGATSVGDATAGETPPADAAGETPPVDAAAGETPPADAAAGETPAADGAATDPAAGAPSEVTAGVDAAAGVDVGVSAEIDPGVDASAGVSGETAEVPAGDPATTPETGELAEAEAAQAEEEEKGRRKRRFKNEALDRMRAAAERGEEPAPVEEEPREENGGRDHLDAMAAAARGPELAGEFELEGTGPADDSRGRVEVGVDGVARVSARDLPAPAELGADLNVFVLWGVDPRSGMSRNLGVLQGAGDGLWAATLSDIEPGAVLVVTAEQGPQSPTRSGPAVLGGRWEQ